MADRALVIGVGTYGPGSGLVSHPTISASAQRYGEVLSRDSFMGPDGCRVLSEDEVADRDSILRAVEQAAAKTGSEDRLVVVYVGHGKRWLGAHNEDVHFATAESTEKHPWKWLSGDDLYAVLRTAKAKLTVLIADCCYSDLLPTLGEDDGPGAAWLGALGGELKGTCVLAAVNGEGRGSDRHRASAQACAELPGTLRTCTPFSGHLLNLLENSTPTDVARFTLGGLRDLLTEDMANCPTNHPTPDMRLSRATDRTPIFRDPAAVRAGIVRTSPQDCDGWIELLATDPSRLPELMKNEWMAGDVTARLLEVPRSGFPSLRRDIAANADQDYRPEAFARYLSRADAGHVPAGPPGAGPTPSGGTRSTANLEWVMWVRPGEFVKRLHAMREGQPGAPPMPKQTIVAMRDFAVHRTIPDLLELARHAAGHDDALQALATAALRRPPEEAARLVVQHLWETRAAGGAPEATDATDGIDDLTGAVIDDVAGQRTALDLADFLSACRDPGVREEEARQVAVRTIDRFTSADSGRSQKDKARLYVLLYESDLLEEADRVMRGSLMHLDPGEGGSLAEDSRTVEFAEALGTLNPSRPLLVDWIADRLRSQQEGAGYKAYRRLVAQLLYGDPASRRRLVEMLGRLDPQDMVVILHLLFEAADDEVFAESRRYAASTPDSTQLARLVAAWEKEFGLDACLRGFLGDIVGVGGGPDGGPRTPDGLEALAGAMERFGASPECRQMLWREAAHRVEGRTGEDVVWLLGRIPSTRHRRIAEQRAARQMAGAVLTAAAPVDQFVQYLRALHGTTGFDPRTAVFLACKELADPERSDRRLRAPVPVLAETAVRLYGAGLLSYAEDLLERCMEDEHRMRADDLRSLVASLLADGFPVTELTTLLKNTLGRWSDALRRADAVDAVGAGLRETLQATGDAEAAGLLNVVMALR